MKSSGNTKIYLFILSGVLFFLLTRCTKNNDNDNSSSPGPVPTLSTSAVTAIMSTTAVCGGNITNDGGKTVTTRGVCWSTGLTPTLSDNKTTDGTGAGEYISTITNLNPTTTYYVRAYATTPNGTGYGSTMSFKTSPPTVTDIDGNIYSTVAIGTQVWMVENLKTTRYNDGTSIPYVTDEDAWIDLTTAAYCWPNNDISNLSPYGAMYNWYAVNSGKLAPTGWHVATDADWNTLITFAGGDSIAGGKLKAAGITYWESPNTGGTDDYGFTLLPAGYRSVANGTWVNFSYWAVLWSATEEQPGFAGRCRIVNTAAFFDLKSTDERFGFSVRCIKN
jgi:uncharacterized protein (TIGR02145 family)